jgi:hypothetical protein
VRPLFVVLALTLPIGLGATLYLSSAPAKKGAEQWLMRHYAATMTPPKSTPHAGIIISASPRPPVSGSEYVEKRGQPISPQPSAVGK